MTQAKHTQFAMKAIDLAEMFKMMFGSKPLEGDVTYAIELGTPDGPSTGGGKQAMQPIKLIPQSGGPTLVAGHANQVEQAAELRSYDLLVEQHSQRFRGAQLPLARPVYDELEKRLEMFFRNQGMKVTHAQSSAPASVAEDTSEAAIAAAGIRQRSPMPMVAVAAVVVLGAAAFFLIR